jgi:Resolvase, N terminal domain/Transposase
MTKTQVEVITSVQRRRRWSRVEKERIVAAALEPGAVASEVAREAGIHASQLFRWRQQLCKRTSAPVAFYPVAVCCSRPLGWSYRLGRSLIDLLGTIQHLEAVGVDLYLDQQAIDTTTPMGKLVFQVTGAFAEFERSMIRQRVKAGLKRAVAQGRRLGRPKVDIALERKAQKQLQKGVGILKVAKTLGLGTGTVQRIKQEMGAT